MKYRPVLIVAVSAILFATVVIFLMRGCLSKYDERAAIGHVLLFEKNGQTIVFTLISSEKATSVSQNGGFTQKSVSTSYWAQINDAATGAKIKDRKIKGHSAIKSWPVEILGAAHDLAWVFMGEIMAVDPFTLETKTDAAGIEQKNPSLKGQLPEERQFYEFNTASGNIRITAKNGTRWELNTATLLARPLPEEETARLNPKERVEAEEKTIYAAIDSLYQQFSRRPDEAYRQHQISYDQYMKLTREYNSKRDSLFNIRDSIQKKSRVIEKQFRAEEELQSTMENLQRNARDIHSITVNQDSIDGRWYGLYTQAEIQKLYNRFQYRTSYEKATRRKLRTTNLYYDEKLDDWIIDLDNPNPLTDHEYLEAGLLLDKKTGRPLRLKGPDGFLIISRSQVGREGTILINRTALTGESSWELNTELVEWSDWIQEGNYLIIFGKDNDKLSSDEINLMISVDLNTGKAVKYDYFTDKLRGTDKK